MDKYVKWLIFFALLSLLIILPKRIDDYQFLIFSLFPVLYIIFNFVYPKTFPIKIIAADIGWIAFGIWGFLSYAWAINGSLVWHYAFGWATMVVWMILVRSCLQKAEMVKILIGLFQILGVIFCLYYILYFAIITYNDRYLAIDTTVGLSNKIALLVGLPIKQHLFPINVPEFWNFIFGDNCNVTALYFISLLPFLLFTTSNSTLAKSIKVISLLIAMNLLYEASSIGVLIAFLVVLLFYCLLIYPIRYLKFFIGGAAFFILLVLSISIYDNSIFSYTPILGQLLQGRDGGRYFMVVDAIRVFFDHPILGIGFSNWPLVHNHSLTTITFSNDLIPSIRLGNHVIYSLVAAELGIIGFGIFISTFFYTIFKGIKARNKLSIAKKAALSALIVYAIALLFYEGAVLRPYFFCKAQLIAFCSLGLLTMDEPAKFKLPIGWKVVILLFCLSSLSWFIYSFKTNRLYAEVKKIEREDTDKAFNLLATIYHPVFKTIDGREASISLKLANLAVRQKKYEVAQKYYQKAMEEASYDEMVFLNYAKFLVRHKGNGLEAKKYVDKAAANQGNLDALNFLLAEIAIENNNYKQAKYYLHKKKYPDSYDLVEKLMELKLYSTDYMDELVRFTPNQKEAFGNSWAAQLENKQAIIKDLERFDDVTFFNDAVEKKVLKKEILKKHIQFEAAIFNILTESQFQKYLMDRFAEKINYIAAAFSNNLDLPAEQQKLLYALLKKDYFQQRILKIKIEIASNQGNDKALNLLKKESRKGMSSYTYNLKKILSKEQYDKYVSNNQFGRRRY